MRLTLFAALAVGALIAGCSSHDGRDRTDRHDRRVTSNDRYATGSEREDWNRTHYDPTCGHWVNPKTAPYQDAYLGQRYYFDSEDCWKRFHDNPSAYLPGYDENPRAREVR